MYTEIVKIIEAGLTNDSQKVLSYSKLLEQKLRKDGDEKMANLIAKAINNRQVSTMSMDSLVTAPPIDHESRLNTVDIIPCNTKDINIILPDLVQSRVSDFIDMVKFQIELSANGIEFNNTLLLYGAPGCGKTTTAQFIANNLNLPIVVARLDAIVSSLLGNTAKNIRKIFEFASKQPCILLLDEFDAIAKARDDKHELGELKRVINSLLQNIDSFPKNNILIAATNHPELLDKAIWRRFNHVIEMNPPLETEISKLLKLFIQSFPTDFLDDEKKIEKISKLLMGKSPSVIKTIVNNCKAHVIIKQLGEISFENFLIELYDYSTHGNSNLEKLVEFLYENGVTQNAIVDSLKISIRQVRNIVSNK